MGSGISRMGSGTYSGAGPQRGSRPSVRRSISSVLICGAASSSTEVDDYPAELVVNSAEHCHRKKLKSPRENSLSEGNGDDLISIKTENVDSSRRLLGAYENSILEVGSSHDDPSDKGKLFSRSRDLVPSQQCGGSSRCNETSSSSDGGQPSRLCASENEMSSRNGQNDINNMRCDTSQISQGLSNSGVCCNSLGESMLDEVSVENNVSEEIGYSSSNFGSFVSDSPLDFNFLRDDIAQEVTPADIGFLVSEREHNRQVDNLLHVDVLSISNTLPANSAEISNRETRRNSRRLFWDTFSRRSSRRRAGSRTFVFSPAASDHLRSPDRQLLDFSGGFIDEEFGVDLSSHGSRIPDINDRRLNPRHEIWDNLSGTLHSTDYPPPACPRGVHVDGSCFCQSDSLAEESGPRTGISRIVMLAEALFEVLDQIHQQPMTLSMSVVSLPAPESVVNSFPVKTHTKSGKLACTDDISQCYICLAEYEEGDSIRVLPCHHEYHVSCVDKWLKEIHGVCPLCRGEVSLGSTESG